MSLSAIRSRLPRWADTPRGLFRALQNAAERHPARCAAGSALIGTCLLPAFRSDDTIVFTNSFTAILTAAALFYLFRAVYRAPRDRRELLFTHVFGLMLSWMTAFGRAGEVLGEIRYGRPFFWVSILFFGHAFACGLSLLWRKLIRLESALAAWKPRRSLSRRLYGALDYVIAHPLLLWLLILLCWLPCYIALFPGNFSYDMTGEFEQQYAAYNKDYPRLHSVLLIGILNGIHKLTGSYNAGIAVFTAAQMMLFAAMAAHMLIAFYDRQNGRLLQPILLAYMAGFPVVHLSVTHTGRDALFGMLLAYTCFLFYRLCTDRQSFLRSYARPVLLGAVLSLTLLARNNSGERVMLALLLAIHLVVWLFVRRINKRGFLVFCVAGLLVYGGLNYVLREVCQPSTMTNYNSSMSLQGQTLARAYFYEPEKWSDEDRNKLVCYVNIHEFDYHPELADSSKHHIKNEALAADYAGFMKFWLHIGRKCPKAYADAFVMQTRYLWYPDALIDGYVRSGHYRNSEKNYMAVGTSEPGSERHLWPSLENFYRRIGTSVSFERIPLISMLFSIGFQFWLLLGGFFYAAWRGRRDLFLPYGLMTAYMLLGFFLPIVLMRYFIALFLFFPLNLVMIFRPAGTAEVPQ